MASLLNTSVSELRKSTESNALRKQLSEAFADNQADVYVMQANELTEIWLQTQLGQGKSEEEANTLFEKLTDLSIYVVREHTSTISSGAVLSKLASDMRRSGSIFGTYRQVRHSGFEFIVFQGRPALRKYLRSGSYHMKSPTLVKLGIGKAAAGAMLRSGLLLTMVISPAIRSLEWLMLDRHGTIEAVLGNISTDLVKGALSAAAGYYAMATFAGTALTVAVLPLAAGIAAGLIIATTLNILDENFGITDKIVAALIEKRQDWLIQTAPTRRQFNYYLFSTEGGLKFIEKMIPGQRFGY